MVARSSKLTVGCLLMLAATTAAQQTGSIVGVVRDKDFDVPLAGATVMIVETSAQTKTDANGGFSLREVPRGTYTFIVSKQGYLRVVRGKTTVAAGKVTNVRVAMLGDFKDLEEFIVREQVIANTSSAQSTLDARLNSAAIMDAISNEQISKTGASDAAGALRLVSGASTQDGKSAVIRGLPDRYVSTQVNGALMPSSDEDKRAVELDFVPSSAIQSLQISKTFTPDQQGNASGGAVNILLRSVPEEPFFFNWKTGSSYNSQVTGRDDFLTYDGGGVHGFGRGGGERNIQEVGENWAGAVGAENGEAPDNFNWSGSFGGSFDVGDGWRAGGFSNFYYDRSSSGFENARDESRTIGQIGNLMTPQIVQGTITQAPFFTSLLSIDQSTQAVQFGGLSTVGIASDDHSFNLTHLFSRIAEDRVTVAEDTQGKHYFFPGHDPDDPASPGYADGDSAPYTRQQTLAYTERGTESLQLGGRHRWELWGYGSLRAVEMDWTIARNSAMRNTPDRREFGSYWDPNARSYFQLKPAAEFTLGNLQRTFIRIEEESEQLALNFKFPLQFWGGREGYFKVGHFQDDVSRTFNQETFSNFSDPNNGFAGEWDETRWSEAWLFEDHVITAAETDVDYSGSQKIEAQYLMLEVPVTDSFRMVGGVRFEGTDISISSSPEENATWVPSVDAMGNPNYGIASFPVGPEDPNFDQSLFDLANPKRSQDDVLPAIALIYDVVDGVTVRASYSKTLARQTFKELSPVFQQEYIGGPVFIGDPNLEISDVENLDFRLDYVPRQGSLLSVSYFKKVIDNPIEYVEAAQGFTFTKPVNYPRGKLAGWEAEIRQDVGELWGPASGFTLGGNSTWIDATVRRPDQEIQQFEQFQGVRPATTRDMTDAPEYLFNLFATYDIESTGTSFGAFYTLTGDKLIQGPGPSNNNFIPATYDKAYDNLSLTFAQRLGSSVTLSFTASNLTNANRQQVYRSDFLEADVVRRDYTRGISYSLSIGGVVQF